jgi:hypothetical protein
MHEAWHREGEIMKARFVWRSLVVGVVTVSAAVAGLVGAPGAFAYGAVDHPVAQVEISANCDNPNFPLCAPEPDGVGTGGVWVWSELDADGSMDATVTFCGHVVGAGGPGSAGAGGGPVRTGQWWTTTTLADTPPGAFPFFDTSKNYSGYYVLDFFPGSGADDFIAVVPAPQGHYSWRPAPAVTIQTQVAP